MSVINKMLKDLEQRHDDVDMDGINAVYQPPERKTINYIVIALSIVVLGLAIVISWLLFKDDSAKNSPEQTTPIVQKKNAQIVPKLVKIKPLIPAVEKRKVEQLQTTEDERVDQLQALSQQDQALAEVEITDNEVPVKVLKKVEPVVPLIVKPKGQLSTATASTAPTPNVKSELTIVKSSERYSPEQRLEQLMIKAQSSFDKGYVSEAVEKLNKVLSISDGHVDARNLLAVAWYGRGELQQAVSILNDGLSKYPNVEIWRMTAAKIYFKENNIKGAFSYLDIELTNATLEFYSMKASIARKLEKYESAESAYLMLTRLQPDLGNWWLGHAISLDSQGKFDSAVLSYQTAAAKGGMLRSTMDFVANRIQELKQ